VKRRQLLRTLCAGVAGTVALPLASLTTSTKAVFKRAVPPEVSTTALCEGATPTSRNTRVFIDADGPLMVAHNGETRIVPTRKVVDVPHPFMEVLKHSQYSNRLHIRRL
jgi:hypothetical protein